MSTIPPSASLNLPPVTMSGKYVMEEHDSYSDQVWSVDELPSKQGYYLQGNYLRCVAEVSVRCSSLTLREGKSPGFRCTQICGDRTLKARY